MEEKFYIQIKKLINQIDLKNLNFKLIKSNVIKLIIVYRELKKLWNKIDSNSIKYNVYEINDKKYNEIMNIINKNFLSDNPLIKVIISNTKYIHMFNYSNMYFYWISENDEKNLKDNKYFIAFNMFKISLTLNLYKYGINDIITRYVIWIPINKKRNYVYDNINKYNLNKSQESFEAFVASGVTFDYNPRITIITRYEEVEKLLIHELIHNYEIDGSCFHNQMDNVLNEYKKIKNKGNYHYEYSIYESYTEILSTYFYLLFINIKSELEDKELEEKIFGQILLEIIYSYNLICNLIKLNGYSSYTEFRTKMAFDGKICKYEYYFVKGLMYNNWELKLGNKLEDFINIYKSIVTMIKNIKITDDLMLKNIYVYFVEQQNFKYQIH